MEPMDSKPSWAWNLDEMRTAGVVDQKLRSPPKEEPVSASVSHISGFTPINQAPCSNDGREVAAPIQEASKPRKGKVTKRAATVPGQGRKRKSINSSAIKSESKNPAKKPRQRKARSVGQDPGKGTQDISKVLVIRKPRLSNQDTVGWNTQVAVKPGSIEEISDDDFPVPENRPTHAGLGQTYQKAYGAQVIHSTETSDDHLELANSDTTLRDSSDCAEHQRAQSGIVYQESLIGAADVRPHDLNETASVTQDYVQLGNVQTEDLDIQKSVCDNCETRKIRSVDSDDFSDDAIERAVFEEFYADPAHLDRFSSVLENDHNLDDQTTKNLGEVIRSEYQDHDSTLCNIDTDVDVINGLTEDEIDGMIDSATICNNNQLHAQASLATQDSFDDEELEAELLNVELTTPERTHCESPPFTQRTPAVPRLQWMPPTPYTPLKRQQLSVSPTNAKSPATLGAPSSPLAEKSPNVQKRNVPSEQGHMVPFARSPFPASLLSRTPVSGLSTNPSLRTCFRIGEALQSASFAQRQSLDVVVELYCRVKHSYREENGYKQVFEFCDLFHPERPPFLPGHYAIWKGTDFWEHDSRQFLGENDGKKMARVVGRMQRGAANKCWEMTVLSIWEATWEDVDIVKGIYST